MRFTLRDQFGNTTAARWSSAEAAEVTRQEMQKISDRGWKVVALFTAEEVRVG